MEEKRDEDINPNTGKRWFEASFKRESRRGKDLTNYIILRKTDP